MADFIGLINIRCLFQIAFGNRFGNVCHAANRIGNGDGDEERDKSNNQCDNDRNNNDGGSKRIDRDINLGNTLFGDNDPGNSARKIDRGINREDVVSIIIRNYPGVAVTSDGLTDGFRIHAIVLNGAIKTSDNGMSGRIEVGIRTHLLIHTHEIRFASFTHSHTFLHNIVDRIERNLVNEDSHSSSELILQR
ncbi:hypothetical protein BMS3Bbin04_01505 [bacterium BMS3Bbin04]|nr:hypothetical protein BMS3Bbin04_01505 [bacterium BMS3Bbin04]